ncbi:MAG: BRO family protein [Coprococcus sp.]
MNKIQEFFNEQFGSIRSVIIDDIVYFYGIDIAKALGYSNASKAITTHCKK